jgi:hypothetical protein
VRVSPFSHLLCCTSSLSLNLPFIHLAISNDYGGTDVAQLTDALLETVLVSSCGSIQADAGSIVGSPTKLR